MNIKMRFRILHYIIGILVLALIVSWVMIGFKSSENKELRDQNNQLFESIIAQDRAKADMDDVEAIDNLNLVNAKYIGEYEITYYCSCSKCCGEYAHNRPTINNKEIVTTASGAYAQEGLTVAVDPDIIPYGTLLYIDGVGYRIAQDCGGAIKGNRIDVYMDTHQEALQGGRHESKIYIITIGGTNNE